jgi:hypothetical protein
MCKYCNLGHLFFFFIYIESHFRFEAWFRQVGYLIHKIIVYSAAFFPMTKIQCLCIFSTLFFVSGMSDSYFYCFAGTCTYRRVGDTQTSFYSQIHTWLKNTILYCWTKVWMHVLYINIYIYKCINTHKGF